MNINVDLINYILTGIIIAMMSLVIWFIIYTFLIKKKKPDEIVLEISKNISEEDQSEENLFQIKRIKKKKSKDMKKDKESAEKENPSIQPAHSLLNFDSIFNDMLIKNDGTLYSMAIQCRGVNFDIMSQNEKSQIEQSFIKLLNSIDYPFQIHVQTRTLDYKGNMLVYNQRITELENELRETIKKFRKLQSDPNQDRKNIVAIVREIQKKQRLLEYAKELRSIVEKMSRYSFILQNNYYIIISCSAREFDITRDYSHESNLGIISTELTNRCQNIIEHLEKCGVGGNIVKAHQLAELLYNTFYQQEDDITKLRNVIESGFFRFYPTSKSLI